MSKKKGKKKRKKKEEVRCGVTIGDVTSLSYQVRLLILPYTGLSTCKKHVKYFNLSPRITTALAPWQPPTRAGCAPADNRPV